MNHWIFRLWFPILDTRYHQDIRGKELMMWNDTSVHIESCSLVFARSAVMYARGNRKLSFVVRACSYVFAELTRMAIGFCTVGSVPRCFFDYHQLYLIMSLYYYFLCSCTIKCRFHHPCCKGLFIKHSSNIHMSYCVCYHRLSRSFLPATLDYV